MSERTRDNLLDAFWSLYCKRPLAQITVKEVAAKAGYNRGTFYEYFTDVQQCLELLEARCLPTFEELPSLPDSDAPSPAFIENFMALYERKRAYYDILLGDRGDPAFRQRFIDSIKAIIIAEVDAKTDSIASLPRDRLELDLALEYRLSGLLGIMRYCSRAAPRGSREELVKAIYRVLGAEDQRGTETSNPSRA